MKIRNLSSQVQELSVVDRSNRSITYSIYIQAKKDLELEKTLVILNLNTLKSRGIIKVIDEYVPNVVETPEIPEEVSETPEIPEESEDLENLDAEEEVSTVEDTEVVESDPETPEIPEESEDLENLDAEEEVSTVEDTEVVESDPETTSEDSDIHICPQCGKEFASSRSLTMHINKSHKE